MMWRDNLSVLSNPSEQEFKGITLKERKAEFLAMIREELPRLFSFMEPKKQEQAQLLIKHAEEITEYCFEWLFRFNKLINTANNPTALVAFIALDENQIANFSGSGENTQILFNLYILFPVAEAWDKADKIALAKANLKMLLAHEFFHRHIQQFYARTDKKTEEANKAADKSFSQEFIYYLDRGELACNLFAIRILSSDFESSSDQQKADREVAGRLLQRLKRDIPLAHAMKNTWQALQELERIRKVLERFPQSRLFFRFLDKLLGITKTESK